MAHTEKRTWEYITLSRTTNPFSAATRPGADNRGQLFAYRFGGTEADGLFLSRLASGGASYEYGVVLFKDASAILLDYTIAGDGLLTAVGGVLSTARSIEAGSNIVVVDGDGVGGNPNISVDDNPVLLGVTATSLTVNGGVVINGGVRMGGAGAPTITAGSSAGTGAAIANVTGHEYNGYFELTIGTLPATGQEARIQFANALANTNYGVWLQSESAGFWVKDPYVRDKTTGGFYVGFGVAGVLGDVFKVSYLVYGRTS